MKKTVFATTAILIMFLALSACQSSTDKTQKKLPQDVVSTTSQPYTGEPGQQKKPELKVYSLNPDGTSQEVSSVGGDNAATAPASGATQELDITAYGFSPSTITMKVGSTLTIKNTDSAPHQPSSDPHPQHTDCPELNAGKPLAQGASYDVVETTPKTCGMHDHLNPSVKATVIVTE